MPLYQNSTVDKTKLVIGNYQMQIATYGSTIGASFTNLGAGIVNSFSHAITKYDVQAGNAPDPIEGISEETFAVEGELIEYNATNLSLLYSGVATVAGTAASNTITFGGKTEMADIAVKLINTRQYTVSGGTTVVSATTTIFIPKATANTGLAFTAKSDNDTDPINVMAFSVLGKIDGTLSVGTQLFTIQRTVGAVA
jgi:hypothetical protein